MAEEQKTKAITMEDLTGIVKAAVADATKDEITALKAKMVDVERKTFFPSGDGKFGASDHETSDGSVVDTSVFHKSYFGAGRAGALTGDPRQDGDVMGKQLLSIGGPFKKLSKSMETFAEIIRCRGRINKMQSRGIDIFKHNAAQFEQMVKCGIVTPEMKAAGMSEGVVADGGALVPVEYPATLIEFAVAQSVILSQVWRMPMTTNVMRIPRLQQAAGNYFGGVQVYAPDEGDLKTSSKPGFDRLEFNAKKLIGLVYLTDELIADSPLNIINYVTALFTRAIQYEIESRIISGTGVGPCMGILNTAGVHSVGRTTAGAISYQDVIALDSAIDENINGLTWMTRKATQNSLMGLVDLQNRPIFLADYAVFAGQPAHPNTMIGYPVIRTRNVPALGANGDLMLGDLSWYMLAIRQDMTVDTSEHVRFAYDETAVRMVMRLDGQAVVPSAFAKLAAGVSS